MQSPSDRRRAPRVQVNGQFALLYGHIDRYVTDVSLTGAFIRAQELPSVGDELPLNLTVADEGIDRISGTGRVVRVERDGPGGMAVEFLELDAESRALIQTLIYRGDQPPRPRPPIRFANPQD